MYRTEYCGAFGVGHLGARVAACGWVATRRDMGGIIFLDLADKQGVLQVVCDAAALPAPAFAAAEKLRMQSVVRVEGRIRERDDETRNPKIPTGDIELYADTLTVLSAAAPLPFTPGERAVREDLRLRHRYLDLRRPEMQRNLRFRHAVQKAAQDFLDAAGFTCVETPMLTKSTPEGARDYLVPSRVHPGSFYALPQSPQIFKQLLMVGGVDRYYQVARCFRDEDLRADRQPEFTQVDMEMAFVEQEDVLRHLEGLFKAVFAAVMDRALREDFPRLTWRQAMDRYGTDKPDLRFDLPIVDLSAILKDSGFGVFRRVLESGGVVRAICVPGGAEKLSRGDIDLLTEKAQGYGAGGMAWIAVRPDGSLNTILTKYFTEAEMDAVLVAAGAGPGDFILFCSGTLATVRRTLGGLRGDIADLLDLRRPGAFSFLFVTDFPQFEYSAEQGRWVATHHPFTMPHPEDLDKLEADPGAVRALAYDVVLNGVELGSGSIRIHDSALQGRMFRALGFTAAEIEARFGFLVEAFRYGTPPHGGFAFGLDRLVMLLLGAPSLREVIAFPKNKEAACPMTSAPDVVPEAQLAELGLAGAAGAGRGAFENAREVVSMDIDKVANLARLWVDEAEKPALEREMRAMVDFAGQLSAIDTEGILPTAHPLPMENVLRPDTVAASLPREALLANAPDAADGLIRVPRVVDEGVE